MFKLKFKFYSICVVFFISFSSANYAQEKSSQNKPSKNLIYFGDLIDVDILGSTEFDWRGTLNPEGFLDGIDFIEEPIYALCRSEEEVAIEVAKGFSKVLRNPQAAVKVLDRSGRAVSYVYGAVKSPQRFQIGRAVRLNELLILAGGIDEKASGEIQILRTNRLNCEDHEKDVSDSTQTNINVNRKESGTKTFNINISDLIKGKSEANPLILNGDIITVAEAEPIYVIGGVENPRKINARSQMTVSKAIASAGGFTKNADLNNIVIFRRRKSESIIIEVDFEKIKLNQADDLNLQKFDIVEVGEKGSTKNKFSPVIKVFEPQIKPLELPLRIIEQ